MNSIAPEKPTCGGYCNAQRCDALERIHAHADVLVGHFRYGGLTPRQVEQHFAALARACMDYLGCVRLGQQGLPCNWQPGLRT
jgi:hypothetical protein